MYNQPFFIPRFYGGMMPNMMRASMGGNMVRGGLFARLGNIFGTIRSFNWGNIINNTSRTLGVINQAIPVVKQVGPMFGNVRSMMKLASVFKDETDIPKKNNSVNKNNYDYNDNKDYTDTGNLNNSSYDNSPNFFI